MNGEQIRNFTSTIQKWVRTGFLCLVSMVHSGCRPPAPDAGPVRFFAPVISEVEVSHPQYWHPMISKERYGIYIKNSWDGDSDLLDLPPVPLWVSPEIAKRVAGLPINLELWKESIEYRDRVHGGVSDLHKNLDRFIAEGKKTSHEIEKIAPDISCPRMSDENNHGFATRLVNGQMIEQTQRGLGGDAILIPNQTVKKTSFSVKGKKQYLFRGKPIFEQDFNKVDAVFSQKEFVVYDGDYVVFWDYPYCKLNAAGKPTWRWYVVKVPKDDPTWFDPEWVKEELVKVAKRIESEKETDYTGIFRGGKPKWKGTLRYMEELQELLKGQTPFKSTEKDSK